MKEKKESKAFLFFEIVAVLMLIGSALFLGAMVSYSEGEDNVIETIQERKELYDMIVISEIIMLVYSAIIRIPNLVPKKPDKDLDSLLSPILSEAIIDGKIGLKEFLMTSIIELNIKKAIQINEINGEITLISTENLSDLHEDVLKILFPDPNKNTITIEEINHKFSDDKEIKNFLNAFVNVKNKIVQKLIDLEIFSKPLYCIGQLFSCIVVLLFINMPFYFILPEDLEANNQITITLDILFSSLIMYIYYLKTIKKTTFTETVVLEEKNGDLVFGIIDSFGALLMSSLNGKTLKNNSDYYLKLSLPLFACMFIFMNFGQIFFKIIINAQLRFYFLSMLTLTILICLINSIMPYTNKGKIEKRKLLGLKKYINEYSLIKDRDLNAVIVWDEYLAYATAFGIPNKVTDKIYKSIYNANINKNCVYEFFLNK